MWTIKELHFVLGTRKRTAMSGKLEKSKIQEIRVTEGNTLLLIFTGNLQWTYKLLKVAPNDKNRMNANTIRLFNKFYT
jgi:hypothetical protein